MVDGYTREPFSLEGRITSVSEMDTGSRFSYELKILEGQLEGHVYNDEVLK